MTRYKQAILDLKDTLYYDTKEGIVLRDGAKELIDYLEESNFPYALATNSTTMSVNEMVSQLNAAGLNTQSRKIINPVPLTISYLKAKGIEKVLIISSSEGIKRQFQSYGIELIADFEDSANVPIVIGYERIQNQVRDLAIRYASIGSEIIALNGRYTRRGKDGRTEDDAMAIALSIAKRAGKCLDDIRIMGKPSNGFFEEILRSNLPFNEPRITIAIGDTPDIDFATPKKMGMGTIQVLAHETGRWDFADYVVREPNEIIEILRKN